ncbi:MAG: LPS assembly lipoprotein LptE [Bacteroidota bacterium]
MILRNKLVNGKWQVASGVHSLLSPLSIVCCLLSIVFLSGCATCKYSFNDVSIPVEVKTFRVNYLENKARYINPQLSPQLTERLKQKIIGTTRLTQTNDDNAHYDVSGYVSDYSVTTTGITNGTSSTNRLTVSFHVSFKNTLDEKKNFESDVTSTFDFSSNQSLSQAEAERNDEIVKNIVDAVFNKVFSNW